MTGGGSIFAVVRLSFFGSRELRVSVNHRGMLNFQCNQCGRTLMISAEYAGQSVACPSCRHVQRAPEADADEGGLELGPVRQAEGLKQTRAASQGVAASQAGSSLVPPPLRQVAGGGSGPGGSGARYGFPCPYCSSRLEATGASAGTEGECPTCGNDIVFPILDGSGRLIDPVTKQIIKQDPHPVHAYAAAGHRAPKIIREAAGQKIVCSRCGSPSPVNANNCKRCGMPFTMEGTAPDALGTTSNSAVASVVLGIIGIPMSCTLVVPGLAVIFGMMALFETRQSETKQGSWLAVTGLVLGVIGLFISAMMYLN